MTNTSQELVQKKKRCKLLSNRLEHTSSELNKIFNYDSDTGTLYWAVSTGPRAFVGKPAGTRHKDGYLSVRVEGTTYLVHRVIWCMVYGEFPPELLDHTDGDGLNNRLLNLREATMAENAANHRLRKSNTSGIKGVNWHVAACKWHARVGFNGVRYTVGFYTSLAEAEAAIKTARDKLHKEFSNHG